MFTSVDKALVALAGALTYLATNFGFEITPEIQRMIDTAVAVLTPLLVYLIPNKKS